MGRGNAALLRSDTILLLLEHRENDGDDKLRELALKILELFDGAGGFSVSIGISDAFFLPREIPSAYNQAFSTALLGRRHYGDNKVTSNQDVGFYRKVHSLSDDEEMATISRELLLPLSRYDRKYRSDLVKTLAMLLRHNGNIAQVAKLLYLHRNTLLHRRNKIIEIYGYSPFEMPYLLNFLLAVQILTE